MKVYSGSRYYNEVIVVDEGQRSSLDPRFDLRNHSPTGFSWGYCGSGPSQLALALLADALGDDSLAIAHYQQFKRQVVSTWQVSWSITDEEIKSWVAQQTESAQV